MTDCVHQLSSTIHASICFSYESCFHHSGLAMELLHLYQQTSEQWIPLF
ncbi:hypothetical protein ACHAWX_001467 [Stephanocyclus meneghinianus]